MGDAIYNRWLMINLKYINNIETHAKELMVIADCTREGEKQAESSMWLRHALQCVPGNALKGS